MKRFLFFSLIWITACAMPRQPVPEEVIYADRLPGVWVVTSRISRLADQRGGGLEELGRLPLCDRDDREIFSRDGIWTQEEGPATCRQQGLIAHGYWWAKGDSLTVMYNDGEQVYYRLQRVTADSIRRSCLVVRAEGRVLLEERLIKLSE